MEHKRCAYGNGIEMYIGIPRKETEKHNESQEKKCCYGRKRRQERPPRKKRKARPGKQKCTATQQTTVRTQQHVGLQKNGQKMTVRI
jgi:hypothetical protein